MKMYSSNDSDTLSPQNFSLNNIVSTLNDDYINKWRSKLENSEKLIFYKAKVKQSVSLKATFHHKQIYLSEIIERN